MTGRIFARNVEEFTAGLGLDFGSSDCFCWPLQQSQRIRSFLAKQLLSSNRTINDWRNISSFQFYSEFFAYEFRNLIHVERAAMFQ